MKTKENNPTRPGSPTPCKQALIYLLSLPPNLIHWTNDSNPNWAIFLSEWKVKARNHYSYVINLHRQRSSSQRSERCFSHVKKMIPPIRIANDVFSPVRKMIRPIISHRGGEFRAKPPSPTPQCVQPSANSFFPRILDNEKWKFYFFFSEKMKIQNQLIHFQFSKKWKWKFFKFVFQFKKKNENECYEWNHGK